MCCIEKTHLLLKFFSFCLTQTRFKKIRSIELNMLFHAISSWSPSCISYLHNILPFALLNIFCRATIAINAWNLGIDCLFELYSHSIVITRVSCYVKLELALHFPFIVTFPTRVFASELESFPKTATIPKRIYISSVICSVRTGCTNRVILLILA